ncbi:MAG: hypothetical protein GY773_05385 [Actinomycetia bacterium]|nr:hypothetical protein [Actinomycetes bacterium]
MSLAENSDDPTRLDRLTSRVVRFRRPSPRLTRLAGVVSVVGFAAIVIWSIVSHGDQLRVDFTLLTVAAVVGTPLALALNYVELRLIARTAGVELSVGEAATTTLFASAANTLPLPGSVVVRGWSLARKGVDLKKIVLTQAVAGLAFIAAGLVITGPLIATASVPVGIMVTGAGVGGLVVLASVTRGGDKELRSRLLAVEGAMVVSELVRISIVLAALDVEVTAARAGGLVGANIVSVAVGVFPAGLGLREALAAASATATGMSAAAAVMVSVADRVATSVVLGLALAVTVGLGQRPAPTGPNQVEPPELSS